MKTRFKIQKLVALKGGANVGRVWETVCSVSRLAVAERTQQRVMIDNPDNSVRISRSSAPIAREMATW